MGRHFRGVYGHGQAYEVQWRPAHCKQHKHYKHSQEVPHITWFQFGALLPFHPMFHLNHQHPNPHVAVRHHQQRDQKVDNHHRDGVVRADRLGEGAGVDAGIVLQRADKEVWYCGEGGEQPGEAQVAARVPQAEQTVVVEAVADVAVAVDGDRRDVEDGADDAEAHDEAAGLAVQVTHGPVIVEDGRQHQRVGVQGHHQVCYGQTHQEDVAWRDRRGPDNKWARLVHD